MSDTDLFIDESSTVMMTEYTEGANCSGGQAKKLTRSNAVINLHVLESYEKFMEALRDSSAQHCMYQRLTVRLFDRFVSMQNYVPDALACFNGLCECADNWKVSNLSEDTKHSYTSLLMWTVDHLRDLRGMYHVLGQFGQRGTYVIPWSHFIYLSWRWSEKKCRNTCHDDQRGVMCYKPDDIQVSLALLDRLYTEGANFLFISEDEV